MTAPTIRRVNHGRGHSYYLNGTKVPGVTTILQAYPKPAIVGWAAKAAAWEVVNHWDELAQLDPEERYEQVRTAPDRDRDEAARRGTEVHRLAQAYIAGGPVDIPDELLGHVDAYRAFDTDWHVREVIVEAPVAHAGLGYCGTLDLIADLADGKRWLLDLKTTRSGIFREVALQLAAYRFAQFYLDADGNVQPLPKVDRCGAVWLRADRSYELTPVRADPETLGLFLHCKQVAAFAAAKDDDVIGAPLVADKPSSEGES